LDRPVLALVGEEGHDVMHFAEFGVVIMLFLIGIELEPALLWKMRTPILGLGGLQVLLTSLVLAGAALLTGLPWQPALALGMIMSLSSTAIVLQTLKEKDCWLPPPGRMPSRCCSSRTLPSFPCWRCCRCWLPIPARGRARMGSIHW
jgi:NhaP-type Na+/H+ or K+/H+ antiporter